MGYIQELHQEIERLQTEKVLLLRSKLVNNQEIELLRSKQEGLENSLELARKQMKILRIGKHVKFGGGKGEL